MNKKGISLVVLGITVIVLAILSGAVLLVSSPNNPVKEAREKAFKTDLINISSNLAQKLGSLEQSQGIDPSEVYVYGKEADEYFPNIGSTYSGKLGIEAGKLVLLRDYEDDEQITEDHKKWAEEAGYKVIPPYYDPPVPGGFIVVQDKVHWQDGFQIYNYELANFTWVPVYSLSEEYKNGRQSIEGADAKYDNYFGTRDYSEYPNAVSKVTKAAGIDKLEVDDSGAKAINNPNVGYEEMAASVEKYGGFYVSSAEMTTIGCAYKGLPLMKSETDDGSNTIQPDLPATHEIETLTAKQFVDKQLFWNPYVTYAMITASHYDSILSWLLSSGALTEQQAFVSARGKGNYFYDSMKYRNNASFGSSEVKTKRANSNFYIAVGSSESTTVKTISDLAGNAPDAVYGKMENTEAIRRSDYDGMANYFPYTDYCIRGSSANEKNTKYMNFANYDVMRADPKVTTRVVMVLE